MTERKRIAMEVFTPSPAIKPEDFHTFLEKLRTTPVPPEEIERRRRISRRVDRLRKSMQPIYEDLKQAARREMEERGL